MKFGANSRSEWSCRASLLANAALEMWASPLTNAPGRGLATPKKAMDMSTIRFVERLRY
ncbi:MAG: hypothetical protein AB7F22_34220 [Reyranella sp.]|uniref:hypothetical protein n=1 Tax=Reyranella sp. TaxID=1929291 RepID=UPI003D0C6192